MLVLKRKVGESVTINNDIVVTLQQTRGAYGYLAIDAPESISIMRTELITVSKAKTNKQARLQGSDAWHDYGRVSFNEAARQEAIKTAMQCSCVAYEWLVETRSENDDDTTPPRIVKVRTFITADIVDSRQEPE